jgi:hypothetical protein
MTPLCSVQDAGVYSPHRRFWTGATSPVQRQYGSVAHACQSGIGDMMRPIRTCRWRRGVG